MVQLKRTITLMMSFIVFVSVVFSGLAAFVPAHATAETQLEYQLLGTHSQAAAQPTSHGKTLHNLEVSNNKLYATYGDYGVNSGPIVINPYNLSTDSFEGSILSVPTEELGSLRLLGGSLYAPMLDPTCSGTCSAGYAFGEPWGHKTTLTAAHLYDIATLNGTDLWVAGSSEVPGTAKLWRSTDGGDTWNLEQSDVASSSSDFERYYWVAVINNKLYVQANNISPQPPVRIFDGSTWTTGISDEIAPPETRVEVYDNKIITTKSKLSAFDGDSIAILSGFRGDTVLDTYTSNDGYFYILTSSGSTRYVSRTKDLSHWTEMGVTNSLASSLAAVGGQLYIGTTDSKLYEASLATIPENPPTVSLSGISEGETVSGTVELTANIASEAAVTGLQFKNYATNIKSYANGNVNTYDWDTTKVADGEYVLSAVVYDTYGSSASSGTISVTVDNTVQPPDDEDSESPAKEETEESTRSFIEAVSETNNLSAENDTDSEVRNVEDQDEELVQPNDTVSPQSQTTTSTTQSSSRVRQFIAIGLVLSGVWVLSLLVRPLFKKP